MFTTIFLCIELSELFIKNTNKIQRVFYYVLNLDIKS